MPHTGHALLGYIGWMMILLGMMAVQRTWLTLRGERAANAFSPTGEDVSPFARRLCRAHANCYEFFPLVGGIWLLALITGFWRVTEPLALWVLAARVAQSVTHLISTSVPAVQLRFAFFLWQYLAIAWWLISFARLIVRY